MAKADMFLKVDGARHGPIKGESQDVEHKDEIDLIGWSWGMKAKTAMSAAGEAPKVTIHELEVVKRVDSASTALMAAMRNNELIKKAVLSVRKAGGSQMEYVKFTIQNGRVTSYDLRSGDIEGERGLTENVTFSFQRVSVEYTPQGADGGKRGAMMFETEIA